MNYREAHPKFSGRVHQHHSLRRNLRRKVRRDDALRTFEIVLRSVKRGKELDSRRCLLRSFWTKKGKDRYTSEKTLDNFHLAQLSGLLKTFKYSVKGQTVHRSKLIDK